MSENDREKGGAKWSKKAVGELSIILSMVFFGGSFTGQRFAMVNGFSPLTYNAGRFFISTILLLLFRPLLQQLMVDVESSDYVSGYIQIKGKESSNAAEFDVNAAEFGVGAGHSKISASPLHSYQSISQQDNDDVAGGAVVLTQESSSESLKQLWIWGGVCGISNFLGSVLQQTSLISISVAKCGFITGMYVVIVPLFEWFIPGHRDSIDKISVTAALCSMIGMYLLSGCTETSDESSCWSSSEGKGELLVFISVFCWVGSIIGSDIGLEKKVCPVAITCVDFVICTVFNIILAVYWEPEQWVYPYTAIRSNIWWMVIVGFTEAIAFLLSTYGQKEIDATRASLLMSLEAVSSAGGGYFFLKETLSVVELFGCLIMFAATLLPTLVDYLNERSEKDKDNYNSNNSNISNNNNNNNNNKITDNQIDGESKPLLGLGIDRMIRSNSESLEKRGVTSMSTAGLRVRSNSKDLELTSIK